MDKMIFDSSNSVEINITTRKIFVSKNDKYYFVKQKYQNPVSLDRDISLTEFKNIFNENKNKQNFVLSGIGDPIVHIKLNEFIKILNQENKNIFIKTAGLMLENYENKIKFDNINGLIIDYCFNEDFFKLYKKDNLNYLLNLLFDFKHLYNLQIIFNINLWNNNLTDIYKIKKFKLQPEIIIDTENFMNKNIALNLYKLLFFKWCQVDTLTLKKRKYSKKMRFLGLF
jgi:hypothetical protein